MTSLAANAIFYKQRTYDFTNTGEKVLAAFWSALIIIPINFVVIFVLKRSASRRMHQQRARKFNISMAMFDEPAIDFNRSLDLVARNRGNESNSRDSDSHPPSYNTNDPFPVRHQPFTLITDNSQSPLNNALHSSPSSVDVSDAFSLESSPSSGSVAQLQKRYSLESSPSLESVTQLQKRYSLESSPSSLTVSHLKRRNIFVRMFSVKFPWWMAVFAYTLWTGLVLLSTLLILIYGTSFDNTLLKGWLLSGWLSVAQDIIFNQPFFNFVSVYLSCH